jgi:type I restriction enzyme, S subunit
MEKKLPKNWVLTTVGSILSTLEIGSRPKGGAGKLTEGIPSISAEHFDYGGRFKFDKLKFIPEDYFNTLKKGILQSGDVLIVKDGATTGKSAYIDAEFPFGKAAVNEHTFILRSYNPVNNKLLFYFTISAAFENHIINTKGGSTIGGIKKGFVDSLIFPLPPTSEQNRIVSKLDHLFSRIDEINTRLNSLPGTIADLKQKLLTNAFSGELTKNWRANRSSENWSEVKMNDLITSIQAGKNFRCPEVPVEIGTVGLVKISAVTWGEFDPKETKTVVDKSKIKKEYFINNGDFLISRANTIELVGASVIVTEIEHDIMISDKVWRVSFKNEIHKEYVNYFLKSRKGRAEIEARASGNQASMRNLSQNNFKDISVPLPSSEEIEKIIRVLELNFSKIKLVTDTINQVRHKLDRLPKAILKKAFEGELVEQLPADGFAEDLLKEIDRLKKQSKPGQLKSNESFKANLTSEKELRNEIKNILQEHEQGMSYPQLLNKISNSIQRKKLIGEIIQDLVISGAMEQVFDDKKEAMKFKYKV